MKILFYLLAVSAILFSCDLQKNEQTEKNQLVQQVEECLLGNDTINLITIFNKDTTKIPTDRFHSIVRYVTGKGFFKPYISKSGSLKIVTEISKTFPVAYDTCNMKRWITKNFIMKNVHVTTLSFTGRKKDKYSGLTPGMLLSEWKFINNIDRDSAMKIVQTAYTYPNNIVMYDKRYSQFIIDDKRIFILEASAKISESYAIEYKKLIEHFIRAKYHG